ncbi:hypothetical protein CUMW_019070 [Citrus unshiu]|nr:hypothetical protein CUMW_019070 [Citrus unshiu]
MKDLSFYVGVIGNIISVLMFLAPVRTFWRIIKHRSTEEFQSLPYICTLLNSSLWTYYGITRPGSYLVATVNGFGILVEAVYVTLFFIYAPNKSNEGTKWDRIFAGNSSVGALCNLQKCKAIKECCEFNGRRSTTRTANYLLKGKDKTLELKGLFAYLDT